MKRRIRGEQGDGVANGVIATLDDPRLGAVSAALGRLRPAAESDAPAVDAIPVPADRVEEMAEIEAVLAEPEVAEPRWLETFDGTLLPRAPLHRSRLPRRLSRCFDRPKRRRRRPRVGA